MTLKVTSIVANKYTSWMIKNLNIYFQKNNLKPVDSTWNVRDAVTHTENVILFDN